MSRPFTIVFWILSAAFIVIVAMLWYNVHGISKTIADQKQLIATQQQRIASQDEVVNKLNNDLSGTRKQLETENTALQKSQSDLVGATGKLQSLQQQLDAANGQLKTLHDQQQALVTANTKAQTDLDSLNNQKVQLISTIQAATQHKQLICHNVGALRDRLTALHVKDPQLEGIVSQKWSECQE